MNLAFGTVRAAVAVLVASVFAAGLAGVTGCAPGGATFMARPADARGAIGAWTQADADVRAPTETGTGTDTDTHTDAEAAMRNNSQRYIVLAVDNPLENPTGRAGSSLGAYGPAPAYVQGSRAAATLAALAQAHGLRQAAAWPIPMLGWHCVVFELPRALPTERPSQPPNQRPSQLPGGRPSLPPNEPPQEWLSPQAREQAAALSRDTLVARLAADPRVRLVQPLQDFEGQAAPDLVPYNDPYVNLQRGFVDTSAAQAHRISTGAGVRIAVVDTGASLGHPDLIGRAVRPRDLVGEGGARFDTDRHGTQVLGVLAATGNNHEGIVGIAPQAEFDLIKACWARASGPGTRCNSYTLAKALGAVLETDAQIVNLSLGGPSDPLLDTLLAELLRQGRVVVGALPPDGQRGGFPTGHTSVIAAGVAGELNRAAADVIAAPGRDVLTLQPGTGYDYASGSSIAAAHVSGVVALLLSAEPRLDSRTLSSLLAHIGGAPLDARVALDTLRNRQNAARGR